MNRHPNPNGRKGIPVVAYNNMAGYEIRFRSMRECAATLNVPLYQVSRRARDGRWIFGDVTVKVRTA